VKLPRITGEHIASAVTTNLNTLGLPLENIRGQGYDGAANMASEKVGVMQGRIRREAPLAIYVHCSGHALNLVITHSCSLPTVRNMLDKLKMTCVFFLFSPKREGLLMAIVNKRVAIATQRKPLSDLCRTRWAERHDAYSRFYLSYVFILETLDIIISGSYAESDSQPDICTEWDAKTKTEATSLMHAITSFEFIVTFMTCYHLLSHLSGVVVKLQSTTLDILQAYCMVCLF